MPIFLSKLLNDDIYVFTVEDRYSLSCLLIFSDFSK